MIPKKEWIHTWLLLNDTGESLRQKSEYNVIKSFQVQHPILVPTNSCTIHVLNHQFRFSYGKPFIGTYEPSCTNQEFTKIVARMHVTVSGRQFDRVGALWMNGVELWRFSSQEPSGKELLTVWDAEKDVSMYSQLFKKPATVVLSLDNVVDQVYTGIFNVTVNLDFYNDMRTESADIIIPLSASQNYYGWFSLPQGPRPVYAAIPPLPQNVAKLYVEVFVSPHSQDEFWYGNIPGTSIPDSGIYGGGSFKEVQVWINDELVGLDWPFPTIYTGGFNPLMWRPIVAIHAFDVPTMMFDITPFASLLFKDSNNDNGSNRIGFNISNSANSVWFVDGNLLVFLDPDQDPQQSFVGSLDVHQVTSKEPNYVESGSLNTTYRASTRLSHYIKATGTIHGSKGKVITSTYKSIDFTNELVLENQGNKETIDQTTNIYDSSMIQTADQPLKVVMESKSFPLKVNLTYTVQNNGFEYDVTMDHGLYHSKKVNTGNESYRITLKNHQVSGGYFGTLRPGVAYLNQSYDFSSPLQCYKRRVEMKNRTILKDVQGC